MQADGRKLVGAEWLHQFAKNIASLCRGHAVAPLPLASSASVRDDAEFWQLLRENAEVVYGVRRTTKDTSAAIVAFVDKRIAEARQRGRMEGATEAGKEMGRVLSAIAIADADAKTTERIAEIRKKYVAETSFEEKYGHKPSCNLMFPATLGTADDHCDCGGVAARVPPAVRRFVHVEGFASGAACVELEDGKSRVIAPDGSTMKADPVSLSMAELFVRRGVWREVPVDG